MNILWHNAIKHFSHMNEYAQSMYHQSNPPQTRTKITSFVHIKDIALTDRKTFRNKLRQRNNSHRLRADKALKNNRGCIYLNNFTNLGDALEFHSGLIITSNNHDRCLFNEIE